MEDKPVFTPKGKKMFNILVDTLGKKSARNILYSIEKRNPRLLKKWRKN
jgi:hypothetical protein